MVVGFFVCFFCLFFVFFVMNIISFKQVTSCSILNGANIKETLSNKHFLFRFFIFLLQQVHITILITKMPKKWGSRTYFLSYSSLKIDRLSTWYKRKQ